MDKETYTLNSKLKNAQSERKPNIADIPKKVVKVVGVGILTFVIAPFVYIILVCVVVAILGFVFKF